MAPSQHKLQFRLPSVLGSVHTGASQRFGNSAFSSVQEGLDLLADVTVELSLFVMINYITDVLNLSITHAAGIINIVDGLTLALPIVFTFFADSFMGHKYMLLLSRIALSIGLGLLFLSTPPMFGPCNEYKEECIGNIQKGLFFTSLVLIVVGKAGYDVSMTYYKIQLKSVEKSVAGAEVVSEGEGEGEDGGEGETVALAGVETKSSTLREILLEIIGNILLELILTLAIMAGFFVLPYIKPWSIRFGIPALCTMIATVSLFLSGFTRYGIKEPNGCPLTIGLRVFVAAASKNFQQVSCKEQIYNDDNIQSTNSLRCLDKAAIKFPDQARSKSWTLCSVSEVEDTKNAIRKVPLWLTFIGFGLVPSVGMSYFLDQANHMDLKLGTIKVAIPYIIFVYLIFYSISQRIYILLKKYFQKRYVSRIGIAIGMFLSVLCCIIAAIVETRRLHVMRDHRLLNIPNERAPMSVFFLVPQFALLAAAQGIANVGMEGHLMHQLPESMKSYTQHFRDFALGLGYMSNVLLVYIVGKLSDRNNHQSWFQHTSNKSRLDRYYWILAGISTVNLIIYSMVAYFYKYNTDADEFEEGGETGILEE